MRILSLAIVVISGASLGACTTAWKPPEIAYDDTPRQAILQPNPPKPVKVVEVPKLLPLPGQLKPLPGAKTEPPEAADPRARVDHANDEARMQPTRARGSAASGGSVFAPGSGFNWPGRGRSLGTSTTFTGFGGLGCRTAWRGVSS